MHAEDTFQVGIAPSVAFGIHRGLRLERLDCFAGDRHPGIEQSLDGIESFAQHSDLRGQLDDKGHHLVDRRIVEENRTFAAGGSREGDLGGCFTHGLGSITRRTRISM